MFDTSDLRRELEKLVASEDCADPVELFRLKAVMDFAWTRACEQYDRSGAWRDEGFAKAASALRVKCGIQQGVANATITLGRKLRTLPETTFAWSHGEITREHAQVIANAYSPERAEALRSLELEPAFVDAAKVADPKTLGSVVQRATDAIDGGTEVQRKHARRRFHMSRTLDGMWVGDFLLDDEDGRTVQQAIETMRGNYQRTETRTAEQARADAFVELCMVGADHMPEGIGHVHADIAVTIDLADLEDRGAADIAADIRTLRGAPLPRATLDRLTCDARIWRVLTDGPSRILDVGRASRDFTVAQKRAILARDKTCTRCGAPGGWCDYHHKIPWEDGGETSVDNGELQCRPCHRKTHEEMRAPP